MAYSSSTPSEQDPSSSLEIFLALRASDLCFSFLLLEISNTRIEPRSHKENPEIVDDDDENENEKKDDDDKKDDDNDDHTDHTLRMEKKYVTDREFWKVHGKVDKVLHEIIPRIAERATNDLIEGNLKRVVVDTIIQERDALQVESYVSNNVIQVHPTTSTLTATTSAILQQQLYLKMKSNLQDQVTDLKLWDVLKSNFEKSSTSTTSCRDDAFCPQHHDDHQEDDAPPEGEKKAKRQKTSKSSKSVRISSLKQPSSTYVYERQQQQQDWDTWIKPQVTDEDEVILKDTTPELIDEIQNADKQIPTIYDYARMMATLNDVMSNEFKDAKEHACHLEQKNVRIMKKTRSPPCIV
ncbi:hypothetical protein Tco_0375320 [Tanacetum coccineum]